MDIILIAIFLANVFLIGFMEYTSSKAACVDVSKLVEEMSVLDIDDEDMMEHIINKHGRIIRVVQTYDDDTYLLPKTEPINPNSVHLHGAYPNKWARYGCRDGKRPQQKPKYKNKLWS